MRKKKILEEINKQANKQAGELQTIQDSLLVLSGRIAYLEQGKNHDYTRMEQMLDNTERILMIYNDVQILLSSQAVEVHLLKNMEAMFGYTMKNIMEEADKFEKLLEEYLKEYHRQKELKKLKKEEKKSSEEVTIEKPVTNVIVSDAQDVTLQTIVIEKQEEISGKIFKKEEEAKKKPEHFRNDVIRRLEEKKPRFKRVSFSSDAIREISLMLNSNYQPTVSATALKILMQPILTQYGKTTQYYEYRDYFIEDGMLIKEKGKAIYHICKDNTIPKNKQNLGILERLGYDKDKVNVS